MVRPRDVERALGRTVPADRLGEGLQIGRAAEVGGVAEIDLPDDHDVGMSEHGVVGHPLGDPVVTAEELEGPGLVGVGDAEAAGRAGLEPGLRHLAEQRERLLRGGALLQDQVPDLAAVALLDERIGGEDGAVQRGGGTEVHAQLFDVDAALGDAAQREDPDVLVVGGVAGDDLQVRVVVGRPVVVVAHEDRAVRGGVLARQDEVAPVRGGGGAGLHLRRRAAAQTGRCGAPEAGHRGKDRDEQDDDQDGAESWRAHGGLRGCRSVSATAERTTAFGTWPEAPASSARGGAQRRRSSQARCMPASSASGTAQ